MAKRSAINPGEVLGVTLGEYQIAVYNLDGEIYATDNLCTHAFAMLSQGWLDGDVIECPLHGGRFDVRTGKGLCPPINDTLKTYPARVVGNDIQIRLE